jgi:succinyl-diaminopimelate desuccinylase
MVPDDREQSVLELVRPEAIAALAARLIDAGGENPGGTEAATVAVLEDEARALGLEVQVRPVAPGRPNLLATLGPAAGADRPGLLFLGHSDVVPAGPGWTRPPFRAAVDRGRLYGRGAADMKGGLAAVLGALAALRRAGTGPSGPVTLACTVDEEEQGTGIRALAGLPYRYRGCVVAEPTGLETVTACRGDSYLELQVTGRPAHSGRPADGRNAILAAVRICELIRTDHHELQLKQDPLLGAGSWNVGLIEGGQGTSVVAPSCRLSLDRRLMPGEDPEEILAGLLSRIRAAGIDTDGIGVAGRVAMQMPGFRTPEDHPLAATALDCVADAGGTARRGGWTAACDGGFIARDHGIPTIVLGPGSLNDQAHQPDESVGLDELTAAARAYALLCLRLLGHNGAREPGTALFEGGTP